MSRGVINIIGEIGKDVFLENVKNQVDSQPNAEGFDVNINSIGGELIEGWSIYEYLLELEDVNTKGLEVVASISSLIFLAGKNRTISTGTKFLCHYPRISNVSDLTSKELKELSVVMEEFDNWLAEEYVKKTNLDFETISKIMDKDEILNTDDLFEWGFTTEKPLKLTAKATLNKNEMSKDNKKLKGLMGLIDKALGGAQVTNKMLYSADQKEVVFPDLEEEDTIEVGDTVTIDDVDLTEQTEVVLADGRTIVVTNGKVEEIIEDEPDDNDLEERVEALANEVKELRVTNKELKDERDEFSEQLETAKSTLKEIKAYGSKIIAKEKRDNKSPFTKPKKKGAFDDAFKNLNQ